MTHPGLQLCNGKLAPHWNTAFCAKLSSKIPANDYALTTLICNLPIDGASWHDNRELMSRLVNARERDGEIIVGMIYLGLLFKILIERPLF